MKLWLHSHSCWRSITIKLTAISSTSDIQLNKRGFVFIDHLWDLQRYYKKTDLQLIYTILIIHKSHIWTPVVFLGYSIDSMRDLSHPVWLGLCQEITVPFHKLMFIPKVLGEVQGKNYLRTTISQLTHREATWQLGSVYYSKNTDSTASWKVKISFCALHCSNSEKGSRENTGRRQKSCFCP